MLSGAGFFAVFGCLWLCAGDYFFEGPIPLWHLAPPLLLGAVLLFWKGRVGRRLSHEPLPPPTAEDQRRAATVRRGFLVVNAVQYLAIAAAVWLCVRLHHQEYIVPAISVIVGLHFIALSPVFRVALHLVVGLVLCLWVAAVLIAAQMNALPAALASAPAPASAAISFGNGVLLILCAVWFLIRAQEGGPAEAGA